MSEPQDGESGTSVITNAMIKEEEGLLAAKNDSAKDDLELLKQDRDMQSQSGRMRRLNHLLQQSSAYSTFLHDRMKKQIEESATKAKRADKRKGNKQASKEKSLGPRRASDRAATGDESTTGTPVRVKRQASQKPVERKKRQKKTIDEEFTIDESQVRSLYCGVVLKSCDRNECIRPCEFCVRLQQSIFLNRTLTTTTTLWKPIQLMLMAAACYQMEKSHLRDNRKCFQGEH